jgi:hypothetical protein
LANFKGLLEKAERCHKAGNLRGYLDKQNGALQCQALLAEKRDAGWNRQCRKTVTEG